MKFLQHNSLRLAKSFLMLLLFCCIGSSCKKDRDEAPATVPVEGVYIAKYGFGDEMPVEQEKYQIRADGIIQQLGMVHGNLLAEGTWQLHGDKFKANFGAIFPPYFEESISASFNNTTGKMEGTWGWGNDSQNGGKIEMNRQ